MINQMREAKDQQHGGERSDTPTPADSSPRPTPNPGAADRAVEQTPRRLPDVAYRDVR